MFLNIIMEAKKNTDFLPCIHCSRIINYRAFGQQSFNLSHNAKVESRAIKKMLVLSLKIIQLIR